MATGAAKDCRGGSQKEDAAFFIELIDMCLKLAATVLSLTFSRRCSSWQNLPKWMQLPVLESRDVLETRQAYCDLEDADWLRAAETDAVANGRHCVLCHVERKSKR